MNWRRFRYFAFAVIWLGIALVLAYGLEPAGDPMILELLCIGGLVFFLSFAMGRKPEGEDEAAGIISFDDDD